MLCGRLKMSLMTWRSGWAFRESDRQLCLDGERVLFGEHQEPRAWRVSFRELGRR